MNYELAQTFLVLAKTKNIAHTAKVLFTSQSTISYRLKVLEDELGCCLFLRQKGRTTGEVTETGFLLLPKIERWLELWDEMIDLKKHSPPSYFKIGCVDSLATHLLGGFFHSFSKKNPSTCFSLYILHTDEMYEKLRNHDIDVGIVLQNLSYPDITVKQFLSEKMYCVHSISKLKGKIVAPSALDAHKEIFLNWGVEFKQWHDFWFKAWTKPTIQTNTPTMIETALRAGEYWAVVPDNTAKSMVNKGICKRVTLESPPPDRVSYIITRSFNKHEQQHLTHNFISEIEKYVRQHI